MPALAEGWVIQSPIDISSYYPRLIAIYGYVDASVARGMLWMGNEQVR